MRRRICDAKAHASGPPSGSPPRQAAAAFEADAGPVIEMERILFDGQLGSQHVRVWLEPHAGGIRLLTHDMGPAPERVFGKDEIETFLEVDGVHLPNLVAALRAERADGRADGPGRAADDEVPRRLDGHDRPSHLAHRPRHPVPLHHRLMLVRRWLP